ncbi:GNAT family N-acetyltransferase [Zhouia sp. PK063]|uniref:GNAT family N-acetyltransferase n=1 Tax=Zhouia sp. PK063 TaxID=3373602 RepID=UPI0037A40F89
MKYEFFQTERLLIRPTEEEDAEFILELLNTPKWINYIGDRNVNTVIEAKEYINKKMRPQLEKLGFSNYTVIRKQDNQKLGTCGLYDREGLDGIDIGFAFLPSYEHQGYALEAAKELKNAAFHVFNIDRISAITKKSNLSSQKLLEKLGLQFSGVTKLLNDEEELYIYKIENEPV